MAHQKMAGNKEVWEGPQSHRDASLASQMTICVNTNPNAHYKYGMSIIHYESHLQIEKLMANWKRGMPVGVEEATGFLIVQAGFQLTM